MAPPVIEAISPIYGPLDGGTAVLIRGSGLAGATKVKFGFDQSELVSVHSDAEIATLSPKPRVGGNTLVTVYVGDTPSNSLTFNYIRNWGGDRQTVFLIEVGYLLLLLSLGAAYASWPPFKSFFSHDLGAVPIIIPWFAALGGVTISLTAVFRHADDWDPSYFFWHIARPFMAVVLGSVAYLIFLGGVLASGSVAVSATPTSGIQGISYDVIAFVGGYREDVLRTLIKRVVDLILNPPGAPAELPRKPLTAPPHLPPIDGAGTVQPETTTAAAALTKSN